MGNLGKIEKRIEVALGILLRPLDGACGEAQLAGPMEVLITRRAAGQVYAGYWEFPGGKVEVGESLEHCLRREMREEVGVEVQPLRSLEVIEHDYAHGRVRLHPFYCRRIAGEARNLQVAEHRWVRIADLGQFTFPEANAEILRRLAADFA